MQGEHLGVGIASKRFPCGPDQCRGGGGGPRLNQHVGGDKLELLLQSGCQRRTGHHEDSFPGNEPPQTVDCLLSGGAGPGQREKLLRVLGSAEGPEPSPGAARENDCPSHDSGAAGQRGSGEVRSIRYPGLVSETSTWGLEQRGQRGTVLAKIVEDRPDVR